MCVVYLARNTINGKEYIGCTIRKLRVRKTAHKRAAINGSKSAFHNAIRKYGFDAFSWCILYENEFATIHELKDVERQYVEDRCSRVPNGYNRTPGGDGGCGRPVGYKHTEETKAKLRRPKTEEHKRAVSIALTRRTPPPITEQTRTKLKKIAQNRSQQYRDRMSVAKTGQRLGRTYSDEVGVDAAAAWRDNLATSMRRRWKNSPKLVCPVCGWSGTAGVFGMHRKRTGH